MSSTWGFPDLSERAYDGDALVAELGAFGGAVANGSRAAVADAPVDP